MASNLAAVPQPLTRDQVGTLFGRTMWLVGLTAAAFGVGVYVSRDLSQGLGWVFFVAALAALFGVSAASTRSEQVAVGLLLGFGFLIGAAVSPLITYYARTDPEALWQAASATALFIFGFGAFGYATRRDLSKLARVFTWALIALIIFGIVIVLVQVPGGSLIYSLLGLVIFAGLTSFDFQRLRRTKDIRTAPLLAASIFLDILNVFTLFLSFTGGRD